MIGLENTNNKNGVQSFESVTANCPEFYNIGFTRSYI